MPPLESPKIILSGGRNTAMLRNEIFTNRTSFAALDKIAEIRTEKQFKEKHPYFIVTAAVSRQYRPPSLMSSWVPMMISTEYRSKYHSHLATTRGRNTHTIRSTAVRCTTSAVQMGIEYGKSLSTRRLTELPPTRLYETLLNRRSSPPLAQDPY